MTSNPNPQLITAPMWKLWDLRPNSSWKLSGFYADKPGYHDTVKKNQSAWPGNYSIKLDLDLHHGNLDKCRAIDLTMSDSEMVKWTTRMRDSALDPHDNRLAAVREFYGTLDNKTVYGLIKDTENGPWRKSSADDSHLWHGHMSVFAAFVNNETKLLPVLSVWAGSSASVAQEDEMFPKQGDTSEDVRYWQNQYNMVRYLMGTPPPSALDVDGEFGPATTDAFTKFAKYSGAQSNYVANRMTGWLATKFNIGLINLLISQRTSPPQVSQADIKAAVDSYLSTALQDNLRITGTVEGTIHYGRS